MGFHLVLSNDIGALASFLADRLALERRACGDPFVSQTLLVPNPHLSKWLQLQFANKSGLSMNLGFHFLEKGLWNLYLESNSFGENQKFRLLEREQIQLLVLFQLLDKDRLDQFPLFKDYLNTPPGLSESARVSRAWQLSDRLARLFSDYEYHREEWIDGWLARPTMPIEDSVETNERDLYLALFGNKGSASKLSEAEKILLTLPQLTRALRQEGKEKPQTPLPPVFLFGFSQISPFHLNLLFEISRSREVFLHAFNHSREVWGDGDSTKGPVEFWGKPGTELLQLIRQVRSEKHPRVEFEEIRVAAPKRPPSTLLDKVQGKVGRQPSGALNAKVAQDCSIQIVGCPGRYREVETVYNSILDNMLKDPKLKLTDIAVLVTDMNAYKPLLESVFNRPQPRIPYNLSDSTAEKDSLFALGLRSLLALADSRFTRREVFDFLFNPLAMEALGVTRQEVRMWLEWSASLNVFGGNTHEETKERPNPFGWWSGLRRLELGRIMETPEARADGSLPHYRGIVPFSDLNSQDAVAVGGFAGAIDSLLKEVGTLSETHLRTVEWIEILHRLTERFLRIPSDRPEEGTVRESLFRSLEDLELLEGSEGKGISFAVFRQFVEAHLKNLPSQRGRFLTGGVTLSSMRPLRPIPFEIVYVLGLDGGQFPGSEQDSTLDLRSRFRQIGDVTHPEANRYLFLETLMVTGKKLYLTYPNRDLQKDREIAPCSVIEELKRVARDYLGDPLKEVHIPISGSSETYLTPPPEWSDACVNYSERDRLICLLGLKEKGQLDPSAFDELADRTDRLIPENFSIPICPPEGELGRVVFLRELKGFLINPLESAARSQLGLYDENEEDSGLEEDEPFYSGFPSDFEILTSALQQTVVKRVTGEDPGADTYFENFYEGKTLCGEVPSGLFGRLDREGFESTLEEIGEVSESESTLTGFLHRVQGCDFYPVLQIGESSERKEGILRFPAVPFTVSDSERKIEVAVQGSLPLVWRNADSLYTLQFAPTSTSAKSLPTKHVLGSYLFYLSLIALEERGDDPFVDGRSLVVGVQFKDQLRTWRYQFSREEATRHLRCLLEDYLLSPSFEALPLHLFSSLGVKDSTRVLEDLRTENPSEEQVGEFQAFVEEHFESLDSDQTFREMELVGLLDAAPPANAFAICQRRLLPFLNGKPMKGLSEVDQEVKE